MDATPERYYLPGDVITFELDVSHNIKLGDAWAVFRAESESGEEDGPQMPLDAVRIEETERRGITVISTITFEIAVDRRRHAPGRYWLDQVRVLPIGVQRTDGIPGIETSIPVDARFVILPEPDAPRIAQRGWRLRHR